MNPLPPLPSYFLTHQPIMLSYIMYTVCRQKVFLLKGRSLSIWWDFGNYSTAAQLRTNFSKSLEFAFLIKCLAGLEQVFTLLIPAQEWTEERRNKHLKPRIFSQYEQAFQPCTLYKKDETKTKSLNTKDIYNTRIQVHPLSVWTILCWNLSVHSQMRCLYRARIT